MNNKIRKYYTGNVISPGLLTISLNSLKALSDLMYSSINFWNSPKYKDYINYYSNLVSSNKQGQQLNNTSTQSGSIFGNQLGANGINALTNLLSGMMSNLLFDDSELGRTLGGLFSTGISSAGNTISDNLLKGQALTQGLALNVGTSLAGAGAGIAANYIGKGISSAMGNSALGKGIGAGTAHALGTIGGKAAGNLIANGTIGNIFKGANAINPYALATSAVGVGIGAAAGPSKEYGSKKYGKAVLIADTIYDGLTAAVNVIPGWGLMISALMSLNKGQSNLFGSTDGMTLLDSVIGSAFMPALLKWINAIGSSKTGNFNNLSWQNAGKVDSFMGSSFGDLASRFDRARDEAGKTYGAFSQGAYREALGNLDFANNAWSKLLAMADKDELLDIRSLYMSSINNQRYAQNIQGGWNPIEIGKQGMKIFNNATNHNIGMRLLSGAALIDNKQMILCSVVD